MSEDAEFQKRLMTQLSFVIDGMKTLNERISGNLESMGRFEAEFTKLSRQNNQLRSDLLDVKTELGQFRAEANQRLQAVLHRIDEIENAVDGNSHHIRELRIEARSQYNDILTAIQSGLQNSISSRELSERVDELERRVGM
ncbi:hypothetical protein HFC70_09390 [Agrobacterium sp. a22-2]|uniref:hypothetical protein n=1 Tax=Agrobacterium sp. a22-2 TaxID=2283840 RepID=UPI001445472D|nr:hypothetical protein [Agrobacterium sp. a22-2]NKN36570.1 hypothetical protein [Agrobacterium sp. a22-2]